MFFIYNGSIFVKKVKIFLKLNKVNAELILNNNTKYVLSDLVRMFETTWLFAQ